MESSHSEIGESDIEERCSSFKKKKHSWWKIKTSKKQKRDDSESVIFSLYPLSFIIF